MADVEIAGESAWADDKAEVNGAVSPNEVEAVETPDEAKAGDAASVPEDGVKSLEDSKNCEDAVEPISPASPISKDVQENTRQRIAPKKAKKSSKGSQKLKVFLLDGRNLDLDGGVSF